MNLWFALKEDSVKRIAIIGDVHGCIEELSELLDCLEQDHITQIFHLGDLVDRGPDSGAVVSQLRERGVFGVMGNHEAKILDQLKKLKTNRLSEDAARTIASLSTHPKNAEYLAALPRLHVVDHILDRPVVLVHGGLWPNLPLWKQPSAVLYAQLINPRKPGDVAWFNDAGALARGLVPWMHEWDGEELVVYGHSVYRAANQIGLTIGIDTGCVFGGSLTALILPDFQYISVPAKRQYVTRENLYRDERSQ